MTRHISPLWSSVCAVLVVLSGASAGAWGFPGHWGAQAGADRGLLLAERGGRRGRSLDRAVGDAQRATGGRVLSAERTERNGRQVFRVKVLTPDGRVRVIETDAGRGDRR